MKAKIFITTCALFIVAACAEARPFYTIDTTAEFDAGTKNGTATDTDEYSHPADQIQLSFPYASKYPHLLSYWRFENNANDETETNNGTVYGASSTSGKFGDCYQFDGGNDYIRCGGNGIANGTCEWVNKKEKKDE